MSIAAVAAGLNIFKSAMGTLGSIEAKKQAKRQMKNQKKVVEATYNYNKKQLTEEFVNNSQLNFEATANYMYESTNEILKNLGVARLNLIDVGGGSSYNSAKSQTVSELTTNYQNMMAEAISARNYNEYSLIKELNDNMYQLEFNKALQTYQIDLDWMNTKREADKQIWSGVFNTITAGLSGVQAGTFGSSAQTSFNNLFGTGAKTTHIYSPLQSMNGNLIGYGG